MAMPTTPHPQQHQQQMPATPGVSPAQPLPPGTLAATAQQRAGMMQPPPPVAGQMAPPPSGVAGGRPSMSGMQQTPDTAGADPVLWTDIDPVLLVRLYPESKSGDEARGKAEQAGADAHAAGLKLVASQQDPTVTQEPAP